MKEIIKIAESFIGNDNSLKAIEYLQNEIPEEKQEIHKQLILLESNYNSIKKKELLGLEDINTISKLRNNLSYKLLNLLATIEDSRYALQTNHDSTIGTEEKYIQISQTPIGKNLGLFILIILIVLTTQYAIFSQRLGISLLIIVVLFLVSALRLIKPKPVPITRKFELNLSNESGVFGGLAGGTLVGVIMGITYYNSP
jgi:hypothetical protein